MSELETPTVSQILIGTCDPTEDADWWKATGSVTLIAQNDVKLLVDTGSPWDKDKLLSALEKCSVTCGDVTHVVCTHGHIDHIGNLNLFHNKCHFILDGDTGKSPGVYKTTDWTVPLQITQDISVIKTPGHTSHDLSVQINGVEDLETVVVAGDIFECEADLKDENIWRQNSWDYEIQLKSRDCILHVADWIIPGHGPMFTAK